MTVPAMPPGSGGVSILATDFTGTHTIATLAKFADTTTIGTELDQITGSSFTGSADDPAAQAIANTAAASILYVRQAGQPIAVLVLDEDDYDPDDPGDTIVFGADSGEQLLTYAVLAPVNSGDATYTVYKITPGAAILNMIGAANASPREVYDGVHGPSLAPTFTATHDSAGVAWPSTIWKQYDLGTTYFDVLSDFAVTGFIDFRINAELELDVFVQNTATGMGADHPTVIFYKGRELTSSAGRHTRKGRASALTVHGEQDTLYTTVTDAPSIAAYGYVEGYDSQGGVTDTATLTTIATYLLAEGKDATDALTVDYALGLVDPETGKPVPTPVPGTTYDLGHHVRTDARRDPATGLLSPQRVMSISRVYNVDGTASVELELNDVILERDVALARLVASLVNSVSPTAPAGTVGADTTVPNTPTGIAVTTVGVTQPDGSVQSYATVAWTPVTQNTDGSTLSDFGGYLVQYRTGAWGSDTTDGWSGGVAVATAGCGLPGFFVPGTLLQARVQCSDYNGHESGWDLSSTVTAAGDSTPPVQPDAPTITAAQLSLLISWDGLDDTGAVQAPDWEYAEVHASTVSNFTPTAATLQDRLVGTPGSTGLGIVTNVLPSLTYYVRLVSVDSSGNRSVAGVIAGPVAPLPLASGSLDPAAVVDTDHSGQFRANDGTLTAGTVVTDANASGGYARKIPSGTTMGGPAYTRLVPGRYRATWRLRTDVTTIGTNVLNVNVVGTPASGLTSDNGTAGIVYQQQSGSTAYQLVSVLFTVNTAADSIALPVQCLSGNVYVDDVYINPVQQFAVAEIGAASIGSVSAGSITVSGTMTAAMTVSGRIATALTGARVEMNSGGLYAYNSAGTQTVRIGSDGSATFTGTVTGSTIDSTSAINGALITGSTFITNYGGYTGLVIGTNPYTVAGYNTSILGISYYEFLGTANPEPPAIGFTASSGFGAKVVQAVMWGGYTDENSSRGGQPAYVQVGAADVYNGTTTNGAVTVGPLLNVTGSVDASGALYWGSSAVSGSMVQSGVNSLLCVGGSGTTSGALYVRMNSSDYGGIYASNFATASSRRWKKNIKTLRLDQAAKILDLRPVAYDLRSDGRHQHGLIAEETIDVMPHVVHPGEDPDDVAYAVNYPGLTADLILLVQDQQKRLAALEGAMSR